MSGPPPDTTPKNAGKTAPILTKWHDFSNFGVKIITMHLQFASESSTIEVTE